MTKRRATNTTSQTLPFARFADLVAPIGLDPTPDLHALDVAIGNARVVLLGEQNHGDGATIALKARLVEHLHLNLGFDVLVFESDFYGLHRAWHELRGPEDVTGLARHVYGMWREGPAVAPLWDLVRARLATDRPLLVAGIDPRHTGAYPKTRVVEDLEAFLACTGATTPDGDAWAVFRALLADLLTKEYEHRVSSLDRRTFLNTLLPFRESIAGDDEESRFWRQELENLVWTARNAWGFEGRDEGMGRNLLWLAHERYPDRRIVVWSHNFHIVKDARTLDAHHAPYARERAKYPDTPLGQVAAEGLGDELISIALLAGEGWYSPHAYRGDSSTRAGLERPPDGSLEHHLLGRGLETAYVDLRNEREPFTMSGVEHDTPIHAPWSRTYDGVLYLRSMHGLESVTTEADPSDATGVQ